MAVEINITQETRDVTINAYAGLRGADGVGVASGGTTGQVLAKASATDYDTEWTDVSSGVLTAYKTVDESKVNDATLTDDSDIQLPLEANSVYEFRSTIMHLSDTISDFKYLFTATTSYLSYTFDLDDVNQLENILNQSKTSNGAGANVIFHIRGILTTTDADTLRLQWSQNTSNTGATTLKKGSNIILKKMN